MGILEGWQQNIFFIVPLGFLPWETCVVFPLEKASCDRCATWPVVPAGCFGVSITYHTLTWTTGSLTCAQVLIHAITPRCTDTTRESALKADSGRKIPCRTEVSNLTSAACRSDALPTELHPNPHDVNEREDLCIQKCMNSVSHIYTSHSYTYLMDCPSSSTRIKRNKDMTDKHPHLFLFLVFVQCLPLDIIQVVQEDSGEAKVTPINAIGGLLLLLLLCQKLTNHLLIQQRLSMLHLIFTEVNTPSFKFLHGCITSVFHNHLWVWAAMLNLFQVVVNFVVALVCVLEERQVRGVKELAKPWEGAKQTILELHWM